MSHIVGIELEIKSLKALEKACKRLGCELVIDQKKHTYYYGQGDCDHAIRVPGASYEVGVVKNDNKGFNLTWDNYSTGGLTHVLGQNAGMLKQAYGIEQAKAAARLKGFSVTEKKLENNEIQLVVNM